VEWLQKTQGYFYSHPLPALRWKQCSKKINRVDRNLSATCKVKCVGCNGLCANGILVSHKNETTNEEILYEKIGTMDAKALADCIANNTQLEDKICDTTQHFFTK
jgi:(2Fe-2S) ferredoxin